MNALELPLLHLPGGRAALLEALPEPDRFAPLAGAGWEDVGLYRLMLAIVYRAAGPFEAFPRRWPRRAVEAYLERHAPRFALWGEGAFLQVEGLEGVGEPKPWHAVSFLKNRADSRVYASHSRWDRPDPVDFPQLLRALPAFLTFTPSSGRSRLGHTAAGPLAGRLALVWEGASLEETLRLQLTPYPEAEWAADRPPWERAPLSAAALPLERPFAGRCDRLVFPSRALRLGPDPRWLWLEAGLKGRSEGPDPMEAPLRPRGDRPPLGPWMALEAQTLRPPPSGAAAVRVCGVEVDKAAVRGVVDSRAPAQSAAELERLAERLEGFARRARALGPAGRELLLEARWRLAEEGLGAPLEASLAAAAAALPLRGWGRALAALEEGEG